MNFTYPKTVGEAISAAFKMFGENYRAANIWRLSVAALVATLAFVFYKLFTEGHASFNTSSDGITWGSVVATYVFFALTSSGLTIIASLATVFGFKQFYPVVKRCIWLAIITLVAGFAALALELGHPFLMLWAVPLGVQIYSPMFWMGVFYTIDLALLIVKLYLMWKEDWDSPFSHFIGIAGFIAVVLASSMLGLLFGSMAMRPMWFGPLIPVYFLLTAALSGAAFAVLITYLTYGGEQAMPDKVRSLMRGAMPKAFAAVLGIVLVATISRTGIGLWSNIDGLQVWSHVVHTPWFWIEMVLMFGAFAMLLMGSGALVPAVMVIAAQFIGRYEFVVDGQMLPLFKGTWVPGLIEYTPSVTEWAIVVMSFAIVFAGWAFGERTLNLGATPQD
ncbi:MAG: NrfD/PsrC family molybdoenzyme membrane anchor subunit [Sulfuricella sp.]